MRFVGNDVVDLNDLECANKHLDARFVDRVFNVLEKQKIADSSKSNQSLWMIWAAKEAAYKVLSKSDAPVAFVHRLFCVQDFNLIRAGVFHTQVNYKEKKVEIEIRCEDLRIHAVGRMAQDPEDNYIYCVGESEIPQNDETILKDFFSGREWQSVQSGESAWVRYCTKKNLAEQLGVSPNALEIVRQKQRRHWGSPVIYLNHRSTPIDVSLSHHGKWTAWAWSLPLSFLKKIKKRTDCSLSIIR